MVIGHPPTFKYKNEGGNEKGYPYLYLFILLVQVHIMSENEPSSTLGYFTWQKICPCIQPLALHILIETLALTYHGPIESTIWFEGGECSSAMETMSDLWSISDKFFLALLVSAATDHYYPKTHYPKSLKSSSHMNHCVWGDIDSHFTHQKHWELSLYKKHLWFRRSDGLWKSMNPSRVIFFGLNWPPTYMVNNYKFEWVIAVSGKSFGHNKGHFTHEPRAVTVKFGEPERKCPKAIPIHLQNHVEWPPIFKCSVKSKCDRALNHMLSQWIFIHTGSHTW